LDLIVKKFRRFVKTYNGIGIKIRKKDSAKRAGLDLRCAEFFEQPKRETIGRILL
jgi:hypothetical protein